MRCKVGDLAIFVGGEGSYNKEKLGFIVEILAPLPPDVYGPFWLIKTSEGKKAEAADRHLKPLPPPGEVTIHDRVANFFKKEPQNVLR